MVNVPTATSSSTGVLMSRLGCGCAMVGEIKKGRYVYYHCTGYKQKCGEPYVREEVLKAKFSHLLGKATVRGERA